MFAQGPFNFFTLFIQFVCLYSAYILLLVLSLALSTFSCVHLLPNKYALPLPMALFKHSRFLCCVMPYFGVSTVSPKKSSSFNMFSTSAIIFIRCLNRHGMRNNIRYQGWVFFHVKSEKIKFLHVKNIWDLSLFLEQDLSDK